MIKTSVILAFYNRVDYLKLVLAGFERQTFKDFEIIIADDGSSSAAVKEIENLSRLMPFPVIHIWHEDRGFRKNKILNQAITAANSDYLIFIDADCIPHREFIKEHINCREKNICLTGRRVNMSKRITRYLTPGRVKDGFLEDNMVMLIEDGIFGKSFYVERGFYIQNKFLRNFINKKKRGMLGSNFSIYKEDFLKINGFDERYEAPSVGEDSDVEYRLGLCGVGVKSINNIAVQYHLYHKLQDRPQVNLDLFDEIKKSGLYYTPFGIKR